MSQHPPAEDSDIPDELAQQLRVEDLERRIVEIESIDSASLGGFTVWDWVACVLGGLVIPGIALWWFAG